MKRLKGLLLSLGVVALVASCDLSSALGVHKQEEEVKATRTLTLNQNDGTSHAKTTTVSGKEGDSITLPKIDSLQGFSRTGVYFRGWSTNMGATAATYSDGSSYTLGSSDATLYVVWGTSVYITYDANFPTDQGASSGSAPLDSAAYKPNDTVTVQDNTSMAVAGCVFVGWSTTQVAVKDAIVGSAIYPAGHVNTITIGTAGTACIKLYAVWMPVFVSGTWTYNPLYMVQRSVSNIIFYNSKEWVPLPTDSYPVMISRMPSGWDTPFIKVRTDQQYQLSYTYPRVLSQSASSGFTNQGKGTLSNILNETFNLPIDYSVPMGASPTQVHTGDTWTLRSDVRFCTVSLQYNPDIVDQIVYNIGAVSGATAAQTANTLTISIPPADASLTGKIGVITLALKANYRSSNSSMNLSFPLTITN